MARGNQREKAREAAQKKAAGVVRIAISCLFSAILGIF